MLQSLSVRNFILIDELDLEFEQGLCVITGETGAGKSILLDAILFCLGSKCGSEIIKNGRESASVTAVFSSSDIIIHLLEIIGIECDDTLVIKRIQLLGNRKKILINDQIVTQKTLDQVSDYLFELHGQNNHTILLNPSAHIDILDNYGNLLNLRSSVSNCFKKWNSIRRELAEISKEKDNIEKEIDYLGFVVAELSKIDIKDGEEEELTILRRNLQNHDKELQLIREVIVQLETPELDQSINKALRILNRNATNTDNFTSISKSLDDAYTNLEEARRGLESLTRNFDKGKHNLDEVEERLFKIKELARKYAVRSDELPKFLHDSANQLTELKEKITNSSKLDSDLINARQEYFALAQILSKDRIATSLKLQSIVETELASLKMERAVFKVQIENVQDVNPMETGIDKVRFVASTNPGMPLSPIDKIASGGELSRFMLALKTSLFDKTTTNTIIFDEVDTGIGGVVADSVGERLKKLSQAAQVIVITHQPQVAGKADQHILVKKIQSDSNTKVHVHKLSREERIKELARMISGKLITEITLKAAKELLM